MTSKTGSRRHSRRTSRVVPSASGSSAYQAVPLANTDGRKRAGSGGIRSRDKVYVTLGPEDRSSSLQAVAPTNDGKSGKQRRPKPLMVVIGVFLAIAVAVALVVIGYTIPRTDDASNESNMSNSNGDASNLPTAAPSMATIVPAAPSLAPTATTQPSPLPAGGPVIVSTEVVDVTESSFRVVIELDRPSHAQIEYGPSEAYGFFTVKEMSFNYARHIQPVVNLAPDTEYHFRVVGLMDETGQVSPPGPDQVVRTAAVSATRPPSTAATAASPTSSSVGVSFASFGVKGDGVADDTEALRAALNGADALIGAPGATYLISGKIRIDSLSTDQEDHWNGAKLTVAAKTNMAFELTKPAGVLRMYDLTIDGNELLENGFFIKSAFDFFRVHLRFLKSATFRSIAIQIDLLDTERFEVARFTHCDCEKIVSIGTGSIGDATGVSRCMQINVQDSSPAMKVEVIGGSWGGTYGDDGDIVGIDQRDGVYNHDVQFIFDGVSFGPFGRRAFKMRTSNVHIVNCVFESAKKDDPNLTGTPSAGMVVLGAFKFPEDVSSGHVVRNTTFRNGGFEGRIIPTSTDGVVFEDCDFGPGTSIAVYIRVGDMRLCNNKFAPGVTFYGYGSFEGMGTSYFGTIEVGTNNEADPNFVKIGDSNFQSIVCN